MAMAEKQLNANGLEQVDGRTVGLYRARFKNTFDMDFEEGAILSDGQYVTMLVTCQVEIPKFTSTKDGVLTRVNQLHALDARVLDNDEAMYLLSNMGENPSEINPGLATVTHLESVKDEGNLLSFFMEEED